MSAETAAGFLKLVAGSAVTGTGLVLAAAAATGVPIPDMVSLPEGHTIADVLMLAVGTVFLVQMRALNKKVEAPESHVQRQLENISLGVNKTADQLTAHRVEFGEFRGNVEARLDNLENKPCKPIA